MSEGLEIPGEVLGAAVIAHAASRGEAQGDAGHAAQGGACANCGNQLTGHFCALCGQRAHVHRSLLHLVEELLHGIFHFETKAWRTLPLLMFRPGRLTREYIDGKRVRYVGPLPLFLFMMFAMFLTFSLTSGSAADLPAKVTKNGVTRTTTIKAETERVTAELAALPASAARNAEQNERAEELESQLKALSMVPALTGDDDANDGELVSQGKPKKHKEPITQEKLHQQLLDAGMTWLATPSFERKIIHADANRELALYKIKSGSAKFAILLVPLTLPFLGLLFLFKRGVNMFDHAVFAFYSLSAMAVLMSLLAILGLFHLGGTVALLATFVPPVHMYLQLKGTYGLSRFGAFWRTVALLTYAAIALLLYLLIVVAISM
ncbi:DUF3667 domain-containing protein [Burkholderiaceae bacterium UC74_6]